MAGLVSYSDTDSDSDNGDDCSNLLEQLPSKKWQVANNETKLPLPTEVLSMFKDNEDIMDKSSDHDGRIRAFPHERGNWASYVFIPLLLTEEILSSLDQFSTHVQKYFSDKKIVLHHLPASDLHISLSRTVPLQFHWISPITSALKEKFSVYQTFTIGLAKVAYYSNDEGTRSFIGLRVTEGHQNLCKLAEEVNVCFSQFQLPKFHKSPSFHVSLLWCLGNILPSVDTQAELILQNKLDTLFYQHDPLLFDVTDIKFRSGNKLFNFEL